MSNYSIDNIKEDILNFFYDDSRDHWIYKYKNNKKAKINGSMVFYLKQLKILFEDRYFHWNTGKALKELASDEQLINWYDYYIQKGEKSKKVRVSLFRRPDQRYFKKNSKTLLKHIQYFDYDMNQAIGRQAELLTKMMFYRLGFQVNACHTNEFRGKKWKKSNHNLDFIVSKDDIYYGVEVKNTFDYIPRKEFDIKMFKLCPFLDLVPMCVFRFAPKFLIHELNEVNGFGLIFKRKILPLGQEQKAKEIWNDTLLPIEVSTNLAPKGEVNFKAWHDKNK